MSKTIHRIVLTGPEATGKTSLAKALADEYATQWVPEYARYYLTHFGPTYQEKDLLTIAKGQLQSERTLISSANRFLFCDTSMVVMKVWSEYKYSRTHPWIEQQLQVHRYDLYFLCYPDLPWAADPLRENANLEERLELYDLYLDILRKHQLPYEVLKGSGAARLAKAKEVLESL
ncbi:MAG: ATP-binding protein [Bacteroidota bacterium]